MPPSAKPKSGFKLKPKTKSRRLNWARYTDFRSRNSKEDLAKLCASLRQDQIKEVFSSADEAGLYPIHWAAIHNRSDLIEYMFDNGSPLEVSCSNRLFANGTALHLAAMNGSIEAADMLLAKCDQLEMCQTNSKSANPDTNVPPAISYETTSGRRSQRALNWLQIRDSEGHTPLLRSAAPRSKRLDTVRDLLRKNLWSLSGRPAEMALFLINAGANWRQTDTKFGMNLMHWAIANDYDDIVNMLLIIDKQLLNINARLAPELVEQRSPATDEVSEPKPGSGNDDSQADDDDFKSIDLGENSSTSSDGSNISKNTARRALLAKTNRAEFQESLTANGLTPLQLAIIYGRVSVINLLWLLTNQVESNTTTTNLSRGSGTKWSRKRGLRDTLIKAYWVNKTELSRLMRSGLLRLALLIDLAILTLAWMPVYMNSGDSVDNRGRSVICEVKDGAFIVAYCLTLAFACRVMLKNPGFLRRSSIQYLSELNFLVDKRSVVEQSVDNRLESSDNQHARATPTGSEFKTISHKKQQVKVIVPNRQKTSQNNGSALPDELKATERVRLLCHKCRCIRRPRSRHCNSCNHCVQEFDHHCIYLGCCIGRQNRFDFLLLMIMVSLTAIYGTALYSAALDRQQLGHFWHFMGLLWIAKYVLIGVLSSFFILRRACLGVTMFEQIYSNRIRRIFGHGGPPDDISKSHRSYNTKKDSFWRYAPDRFLTGDLPAKKVLRNFREFTTYASLSDYFLAIACPDTALARSLTNSDSKVDLYKFV